MNLVLDASITLAWCYEDETTEAVQRSFDIVRTNGAWVPVLWLWEVANVLQMNVRRGRHNAKFRDRALADLALFPIQEDAEAGRQAWSGSLILAERHSLTVYDAAYLEVALRRGLPLATVDRDLRRAASAEKIQVPGM
ncbi:MAG TPA: type II toxin-antitoxin system VapC family toxin [Candidatus Polarisedimenticolia bacterium]|nr:type II toxin-antitoxin system VapC family toxin [Candidatus Polarisedimenticolia bacterium]